MNKRFYPFCFGTLLGRPRNAACYSGDCPVAAECDSFNLILIEYEKRNPDKEKLNELRLGSIDLMNEGYYIPFEKYMAVMIEELNL